MTKQSVEHGHDNHDAPEKDIQTHSTYAAAWNELLQKMEASVLVKIQAHSERHCADHQPSGTVGVDLLDTKNSLLLSYLIELTVWYQRQVQLLQARRNGDESTGSVVESTLAAAMQSQRKRLLELRVALDKLRVLEKSMRYQIDKLLTQHQFFEAAEFRADEQPRQVDPLQFRPRGLDAEASDSDEEDTNDNAQEEEEDDLALAQRTLAKRKEKSASKTDKEEADDGLYRAPRISAHPYPHSQRNDHDDADDNDGINSEDVRGMSSRVRGEERDRARLQRKLRVSEVADTLRAQYSDAPDTDDVHGGTAMGTQHVAAQQFQRRVGQRTQFEEEHMIRLPVTRVEKKQRKALLRQEASNLHAMTDLGNLARDVKHHQTLARGGGGAAARKRGGPSSDKSGKPTKSRR
jgi:U3 small nucleolar ribonucleoprotein protein LCP5